MWKDVTEARIRSLNKQLKSLNDDLSDLLSTPSAYDSFFGSRRASERSNDDRVAHPASYYIFRLFNTEVSVDSGYYVRVRGLPHLSPFMSKTLPTWLSCSVTNNLGMFSFGSFADLDSAVICFSYIVKDICDSSIAPSFELF